ncbi:MAG: M23 family metallopeptidase [Deltaproteobacteria bacterium]
MLLPLLTSLLAATSVTPAPLADWTVDTILIHPGETLASALFAQGLSTIEVEGTLGALAKTLDFKRVRAGTSLRVERRGGAVALVEVHDGPVAEWTVRRDGAAFVGAQRQFQVEKRVVDVDATVTSSLWQAFTDAGEDPQLTLAIADVFAWDVDFYQDPRKGDHIRAIVERMQVGDRVVGYGEVLAAEYAGGTGDHQLFRYVDRTGRASYFDAEGRSAQKSFLKSPLKFARISSGFGMRMHPTLHYRKQHEGVDYVAPTGTPVWAIGDGTIMAAGYKGANGNYIGIRHKNGLETFYCHLSGIAHGIRAGVRVAQKRLIGFVGMTGRATGPHLHFALKKAGSFINPLTFRVPRADPLPAVELPDFRAAIGPLLERLHHEPIAALAPSTVTASR